MGGLTLWGGGEGGAAEEVVTQLGSTTAFDRDVDGEGSIEGKAEDGEGERREEELRGEPALGFEYQRDGAG